MSQEDTVPRGPIEAMERGNDINEEKNGVLTVQGLTRRGQSRLFNWFLGPGPARYQLPPAIGVPNHDPRKWKAPAYSLTGGAKPYKGTGVPGKVYFVVNYFDHNL